MTEEMIQLVENSTQPFPFLAKKLRVLKGQTADINIDERNVRSEQKTALHQAVRRQK